MPSPLEAASPRGRPVPTVTMRSARRPSRPGSPGPPLPRPRPSGLCRLRRSSYGCPAERNGGSMPGPYRLFSADGPSSAAGDTTAYTLGVEFYVTVSGLRLFGFWWWCAPGADPSPKSFQLFQCISDVIGTAVDDASAVSGTLTQGVWNYTALGAPVVIAANQRYRAGILGGGPANWYSAVPSAFPADIVNGPLVAPATANALGGLQGSFNTGAVMAY